MNDAQQIGEAEWHIARAGDPDIFGTNQRPAIDVNNLLKTPPQSRVVPEADRHSRDDLIAAVNSYFDGITAGTGRHVQANPGCLRLENGLGPPASFKLSAEDTEFESKLDCRSGYAGFGIVNVASLSALLAPAGQANYAAAKAGVVALTQSLAKEMARLNITANAVCPGYIETEALTSMTQEQLRAAMAQVPMRRFGRPEEVASAVAFLAGPEASYITGAKLKIDGGIF